MDIRDSCSATYHFISETAEFPSTETTTNSIIDRATIAMGPYFSRQMMSQYLNQSVVDKVPQEMLHLISPHW